MRARSLDDCIKADGGLARLAGHAARLLRLQRIFEATIPRPLARGSRVANLKLGKLVIHADSGMIATKLRQIAPTLVNVFCSEAAEVTGIEIKVQPRDPKPRHADKGEHPTLGGHAKQGLVSLAERLPAGSPLREALRHLVEKS